MSRLVPLAIAAALVAGIAGCGGDGDGGDDLLSEDGLRQCLADAGLGGRTDPGGEALLLFPAPDFVAQTEDGTDVGVTVYGTDEKAERAAADARSTAQTLPGSVEVLSGRNAMLIFDAAPSDQVRQAAEACLG